MLLVLCALGLLTGAGSAGSTAGPGGLLRSDPAVHVVAHPARGQAATVGRRTRRGADLRARPHVVGAGPGPTGLVGLERFVLVLSTPDGGEVVPSPQCTTRPRGPPPAC